MEERGNKNKFNTNLTKHKGKIRALEEAHEISSHCRRDSSQRLRCSSWKHLALLSPFFIFCDINWAHQQDGKQEIHFSSWPNAPKFQSKVQQTIVLTTELSVYTFSLLPFPFRLYMEMKRSFMLFPLVALFIAVWRFISWFHLRFRRLFLGKPLKCVSDSKQSFSRFLSLAPVASSLMMKKPLDFQSELSDPLKPKSIQYCPKEGRCCSCFVADMKGEQRILFVISLISIISTVWMNFKWLAWSYLC